MMTWLFGVRVALVVLSAVLAWVFVIRYSRLDWESTREGAHLMRFTLLVAVILSMWAGFVVFPVSALARTVIAIPLFGLVAYELWTRIRLLEMAQQEAMRRASDADAAAPDQDADADLT